LVDTQAAAEKGHGIDGWARTALDPARGLAQDHWLQNGMNPMGEGPAVTSDISRLIGRWKDGDRDARDRVFSLVYDELRLRARRQLHHHGAATLSPTSLVHETFLKLADGVEVSWEDRRHFLAVASLAMRQILVDHARRRLAQKRGNGVRPDVLDEATVHLDQKAAELVALDDALERLKALDERLARVVDLRFFGGLSFDEAAEVLDLSARTVKREWRKARAYLFRSLGGEATT
jgi:RNA polymerase sigma factor (TIGR02999 family)